MNSQDNLITIDPDDRQQVVEIAKLLDVPPDQLRPLLITLRDRQIVARQIDIYWRRNPEPDPRRGR